MRHCSGQNGDKTAKPLVEPARPLVDLARPLVESARLLVESARQLVESARRSSLCGSLLKRIESLLQQLVKYVRAIESARAIVSVYH